jgi:hypothetical protein
VIERARHPNARYCTHNDFFHAEEFCTVEECKQTNSARRQVVALEEANRLKQQELDRSAPDDREPFYGRFGAPPTPVSQAPRRYRPAPPAVTPQPPTLRGGMNVEPRERPVTDAL